MLTVIPRNCVGCRTCELACSFAHSVDGRFARSRITVHPAGDKRWVQMTCLQCLDAACIRVCPVGALSRSEKTDGVVVDITRCTGCSLCSRACPFGHMAFDPDTRRASKCDLCDGAPKCAQFCPNKALEIR
ncbi:MAG: 4Fe-4S dicluster domain-containing protein [Myxococcota bacterium]|jgi:Fe-S-cluster-containing hydrogenase component 2